MTVAMLADAGRSLKLRSGLCRWRTRAKIPFVDTEAAARYLALSTHLRECYRPLGGTPPFYKFRKLVRYAIADLEPGRRNVGMGERRAATPASTEDS